ncbi:ABC transporter substrate-binding protein [Cytophagaceae bacterium YF14B1]|uniref:ABC transporter substrate-binding protein n=1 Tax=Xanthocytophaga flava TaxID=3048013 RepID=A0AAE3UB35_9BACT|nr:ABC transporter substrate-binding protein [Xanthocytophaga flavus]MDJ1485372.1 ABC transporter substrate-binding protein [Xanthocytophaga flavus]
MKTKKNLTRSSHKRILPLSSLVRCSSWIVALYCLTGILTSCRSSSQSDSAEETTAIQQNYFPEKVQIEYAKGFTIQYFNHYKIVHIFNPFEAKGDTARYLLLQRGTPRPAGYDQYQKIEIPVRSLVGMSSMHVGLVSFLDAQNTLVGLGNLKYVSSPEVLKRIAKGEITEVGNDQAINEEKLIAMHPDLVMTVGSATARMDHYKTLTDAGLPVLINSEWVETTPLARAEWVKLMAALLNKEALANEKFVKIAQEYKRLSDLTRNVKHKPSIITGMTYKDTWFLPDGDSYMAHFFEDAGTDYHWRNEKTTGSLPLSFEAVYPIALEAEYWLNVGFIDTKQDILAKDKRYGDFTSFKTGKVYNYNKRTNEQGANDYWESGAVSPHLILADMIKILHPELLPDHELVYYKQVQ